VVCDHGGVVTQSTPSSPSFVQSKEWHPWVWPKPGSWARGGLWGDSGANRPNQDSDAIDSDIERARPTWRSGTASELTLEQLLKRDG